MKTTFSFNLCINCRNGNNAEPKLFQRLWLQLKSPTPAGSGSTTLDRTKYFIW